MPVAQGNQLYQNMKSYELKQWLDEIELIIKDMLEENQIAMETTKRKERRELQLAVGKFILVHRDAYFSTVPNP